MLISELYRIKYKNKKQIDFELHCHICSEKFWTINFLYKRLEQNLSEKLKSGVSASGQAAAKGPGRLLKWLVLLPDICDGIIGVRTKSLGVKIKYREIKNTIQKLKTNRFSDTLPYKQWKIMDMRLWGKTACISCPGWSAVAWWPGSSHYNPASIISCLKIIQSKYNPGYRFAILTFSIKI